MTLPINYFTISIAAVPLFVFLMLLVFKWGTAEAAPVAALLTVFSSFGFFKSPAMQIAVESSKGIWNALIIVFLLWTACVFYRILKQLAFSDVLDAADMKSGDYHRTDLAKLYTLEKEEDRNGVTKKEALPTLALVVCVVAAGIGLNMVNSSAGISAAGFNFPENGTGYGFVNAAIEKYCPLLPILNAAVILLFIDLIGVFGLLLSKKLRRGSISRILKKSCEMVMPSAIAVCALMMTFALMQGSGQFYVLTVGNVREVPVVAVSFCLILICAAVVYFDDQKQIKKDIEEEKNVEQAKKEGKIKKVHRLKFYETRTGGLTIAFAVIFVAFVFMMIGIWGSDETFTIDGFAAIITALLYCPMRTFIFDKAERLIQ